MNNNLKRRFVNPPSLGAISEKKNTLNRYLEETPRAINFSAGNGDGCSMWRLEWPSQVINSRKLGIISNSFLLLGEEQLYSGGTLKTVKIQRMVSPQHLSFIKHLKSFSEKFGFRIVYEIDDVLFEKYIPEYNSSKKQFAQSVIQRHAREIISMCDGISTPTNYMSNLYTQETGVAAETLPNFPPKWVFDRFYDEKELSIRFDKNKKKPRIVYAGAPLHFDNRNLNGGKDDFSGIVEAIIKTRKKFQWVLMGGRPQKLEQYIQSGEIEFYPWCALIDYPYRFYGLKGNVVIAPLEDNDFNRSKSNIKFLESAALGLPGVFQDMVTYKDAFLKFTTGDDLVDQLTLLFKDKNYYMKMARKSRLFAETKWLEDNIDRYVKSYGFK